MFIRMLFLTVLFFFFSAMFLLSVYLVYPISELTNFCLFVSLLSFFISFFYSYSFKK